MLPIVFYSHVSINQKNKPKLKCHRKPTTDITAVTIIYLKLKMFNAM